jgi:hypothetical protein
MNHYGILIFFFGAALLLWLRSLKPDEMAAYVAHGITAFACIVAAGLGRQYGPAALWVAAAAGFVVNFAFLALRIRNS